MWTRFGRRRHHKEGIFYYNTSKWRPSSWGIHFWRLNWSFTRHVGSFKLPFGLGVEYFGDGENEEGTQRGRRGRRR
jgi:hypothetical protein